MMKVWTCNHPAFCSPDCYISALHFVVHPAGHRRHYRERHPRLLHHTQEGPRQPTSYFVNLLQSAQAAQLSAQEHASRQASLRHHEQHGVRALLRDPRPPAHVSPIFFVAHCKASARSVYSGCSKGAAHHTSCDV